MRIAERWDAVQGQNDLMEYDLRICFKVMYVIIVFYQCVLRMTNLANYIRSKI